MVSFVTSPRVREPTKRDWPHVLLSGPLCAGKTVLAEQLVGKHGYQVVSARLVLRELAREDLPSRVELQEFGTKIESRTRGRWIATYARRRERSTGARLVVDSVRTRLQVAALRSELDRHSIHVHLFADTVELARRFAARREPGIQEALSLEVALGHDSEADVEALRDSADLVIDTTGLALASVTDAVLELLAASELT